MTDQRPWMAMVNVLGTGLIWGLVAAPSLAVLAVVVFFWLIPRLHDTPFLFAFPLAMVVGMTGFFGGFLMALLRQVREALKLPLWCQVVHIVAVLFFGFMTVRLADLAIQTAQDSLAGRIS